MLRPQEISNHPEMIRRLGVLAMNGVIEADIYGNVNSTHLMGSRIQNGIGGSGDFARNAYISFFITPSHGQGRRDLEHRADGLARGPHRARRQRHRDRAGAGRPARAGATQRARLLIDNCAHPDYRPLLDDYFERAQQGAYGRHTPHLLDEALGAGTHRFVRTGTMARPR